MTPAQQIVTIALCVAGTMATRFLPFLIFSDKRPTPKYIQYLGRALPGAVFGLLAGGLASGFVLAVFMANSGGAWDNAKKYIEQGHVGGKGSESHKAAVIGDTVGDPFKDTSGPSLNILIKLMSMVAIVTAGVNIAVTLF